MYAGTSMEQAPCRDIFYANHHPYTEGLLASLPAYSTATAGDGTRVRLRPIPGQPPSLIDLPTGCPFHPRCPYVMDRCRVEVPPLVVVDGDPAHLSACWLPTDPRRRSELRQEITGLELARGSS